MSNANQMPIYSHVVPKSQQNRATKTKNGTNERNSNLPRDFDPLNYNNGGQFLSDARIERDRKREEKELRRKEERKEDKVRRAQAKNDSSEGKVEAYLRQNQVSIRQQQHRHSAVRQAEHRVNLRSLPLNDVASPKAHDKTPSDRHRGFPERERDGTSDRRRERNRERDNVDGTQKSPMTSKPDRDSSRPVVRKSSSSHKVSETTLCTSNRRFFCREWLFQKIAHCLEQRGGSKNCGTLILGEAGSGKTAICHELSEPGQGPQARQQRALNRRLLARHFLQANTESSQRPGEFIRSLAMQILSHSEQHRHKSNANKQVESNEKSPELEITRESDEDNMIRRFETLGEDMEESSKPLLADSEDQRTDEEGETNALPWHRRTRTINRLHEKTEYMDCMADAEPSSVDELPEILPRINSKTTNPFLTDDLHKDSENRVYENHENLFLRNVSQKPAKSGSSKHQDSKTDSETDKSEKTSKIESSPPKSRIPVSKFKSPYKTDIKTSSNENSPQKKIEKNDSLDANKIEKFNSNKIENFDVDKNDILNAYKGEGTNVDLINLNVSDGNANELPEYQNVLNEVEKEEINCDRDGKKRLLSDDVPPPIPSLPVAPRTLIANAYYEKLLSDPEIQQALLPQNLERNPDECFKRAILFPLLEIDPPKQSLFWLIDAIDEGFNGRVKGDRDDSSQPSTSVCQLISRHQHLLPHWLLLLATARRHAKLVTHMFTGCRKITLDELQRTHVSADVQRYVLARLDTEPKLRARVSSDSAAAAAAAAALDHLRIKSDGCMLYLEKVLDGVADGFIALREIKEIPGTLNGLYLWLAQRLFHGRRFTKVRLLLDVLLAARCGVTEEMLYKCLLTKEYSVTREDFNRRLHLLRRILVIDPATGYLSLFHNSFSCWLVDVKHCTRRYLCSPPEGHAALAMYYTLDATRLSVMEIHNYVLHMTHLEQFLQSQKKSKNTSEAEVLDLHTLILLWVLDSGCDVEAALKRDTRIDTALAKAKECDQKDGVFVDVGNTENEMLNTSPLNSIMPELIGDLDNSWPTDAKVLKALLQLSRIDAATEEQESKTDLDSEQATKQSDVIPDLSLLDPLLPHDLAAKGDDEALEALLKRHPSMLNNVDASGGSCLHAAARAGRAGAARVALLAGADPDARDGDGWTPLRAAAWAGHLEVVDVLLEHGCDVDAVDADNRTALRAAAWSGHCAVAARLLSAGAAADGADAEGRSALLAAAYMAHADIARLLLDHGADPEQADRDGRRALSVAALSAAGLEVVSLLIERGAKVNEADKDGATPLIVAAFEGHTAICEALLEAEAEVERCGAGGVGGARRALWAAAGAGHAHTVRALLYWGARVDHMDEDGRTVLAVAAAHGNVEVVRQLLDRGLDENHRDNSGWTPLHYAAFEGHYEVCQALLEAGARLDEVDNDGKCPLMVTCGEGHEQVASLLAGCGAQLDRRAHDANTAARLAALEGHIGCVRLLRSLGCEIDVVDADHRSTLYVLALDNRLEMAKCLITECAANIDSVDAEGRTPLHVAAWQGHSEMIDLLITVGGASVSARDRCGRAALHAAAWRGRAAALARLLRHGADARAQCAQGATPLGIAAQEGHEECVLILLEHGADPLQADHCGRTPAKVAWRAGHANICRLLEAKAAPTAPLSEDILHDNINNSSEYKRRSVHSSNSTKCSSNLTAGSNRSHEKEILDPLVPNRANLSLSFVQQVARCGRGRREKEKVIPKRPVIEKDSKLRSYMGAESDADLVGMSSPLYASPPHSPDLCSPGQEQFLFAPNSQPSSLCPDQHFNRDTHMRIILGRGESKPTPQKSEAKSKRNGIVTNPALRLVANVKNGLDHAAANIRRTGVALAASASSANPAVKTNAFQWRKETPL